MKNHSRLVAGILFGIFLVFAGAVLAQKLGRSTPMAGGPPGQGFLADYDSGITTLPTSATVVTTTTVLVTNIYCANISGAAATVTITDNLGTAYVPAVSMATATVQQFLNAGKGIQMKGIKWNSNTASAINCQIAGYN